LVSQTWESPNFEHNFTSFEGDNDPVDLFDIGQDVGYVGQVKQVKILGCLALNDGNETDWKVLGIDVEDPIAHLVNDYEEVEKYRPGVVKAYRDWFTYYKLARGDSILPIVGEYYQSAEFCTEVIAESHGFWEELVAGTVDSNEINYNQTTLPELESYANDTAALDIPSESDIQLPASKPIRFNDWFYTRQETTLIEL
jgi:inorganic pyrophosphatase